VVPESQYPVATIAKPLVANGITLACRMLPTVNLDDKSMLSAIQVNDI